MVAELVGEHAAQCVVIEFAGGERRHDDQVAATSEGVQIVVVDQTDGESMITDVQGLGHLVEGSLEADRLVACGAAGPDQPSENPALHDRYEEQSSGHHVDGHEGEVPDRHEAADQPPEGDHRQEEDGQDGHQGNQARDGGPIDVSLAGSHPRHCGRPDRSWRGNSCFPLKSSPRSADEPGVNDEEHARSAVDDASNLLERARVVEATDPGRARRMVQDARRIARRDGDPGVEGESLYRLATLAHYDGDPGDAFALAVEADEFADAHGLPLVRAWSLHLIGLIHTDSGNHSEALAQCLRALSIYRSTDHRVDEGNILNTIATIHHELGDADRAIVNYEAALAANEAYDRRDIDALIVANVSSLRSERGEHDEAVELASAALASCRADAPSFLPQVLTASAQVFARRGGDGDVDVARDLLADALHELESSSVTFDDLDRSRIELAYGRLEIEEGRLDEAIAHLRRALEFATLVGARVQMLEAHTDLARAFTGAGRFEEAVPHLEARFDVQSRIHAESTTTRLRTLQVAHEAEQARRQAEILHLRLAVAQHPSSARTSS